MQFGLQQGLQLSSGCDSNLPYDRAFLPHHNASCLAHYLRSLLCEQKTIIVISGIKIYVLSSFFSCSQLCHLVKEQANPDYVSHECASDLCVGVHINAFIFSDATKYHELVQAHIQNEAWTS